jgi:DNA-binding NtrC family response regulator
MEIPPLSDRREDIPILVDHFTAKYNRLQGKEILGLTQEAMGIVMEYDYPGNVRQLQNVIEHAFVLCKGGWIEPRHLPPEMRSRCVDALLRGPYGMNLKSAECLLITEALRESAGNRAFAAAALGIDVSTLYRKILFHHIQTPDSDGRGRRKVRLADLEDNYK